MKKADYITKINAAITEHKLGKKFDAVPEDSDMGVKDLKALLSDVNDAAEAAQGPPTVTVAELCAELELEPKTVRARLRRLYADEDATDLPQPIDGAGQRWTFPEDQREALTALVKNEG